MSDRIIIARATRTCFACPSQWSALTLDGQEVYIRFRWGHLSINVSGERVFDWDDFSGWNGVMSYDDLVEHTKHRFIWPTDEESMGEFEP